MPVKTKNDVSGPQAIRDKTCVVYNGIQPFEMFTLETARAHIQETTGVESSDTLWLGTIAELHANKGLDLIIEAIKEQSVRIENSLKVLEKLELIAKEKGLN